jgi:DNA-binding transcriptional MerR regulator
MDDAALFTIGRLAKRTGLPVRTIRYWSDVGAVPPAGRTGSGHRLYDAACVARLELVATLRELGVGLADVRRVLENKTTMAEVAAVHVKALDTQIAALRLRRAVLATAAKRRLGTKEMTLMNKLAKLSAQERKQIIDDFVTEVFHGLEPDPGIAARLRQATPELPDNPSPEQIGAGWNWSAWSRIPRSADVSGPWPNTAHGSRRAAAAQTVAARTQTAARTQQTVLARTRGPRTSLAASSSMPGRHATEE